MHSSQDQSMNYLQGEWGRSVIDNQRSNEIEL